MLRWVGKERKKMIEGLTSQEREEILALLRRAFKEAEAQTLLVALERIATWRTELVTRQDSQELQGLVAQLVGGQRVLQEALARLAEAQARTEERVGRLEAVVAELTEGQRALQSAVAKLAEAQARTEATLQMLAQQVGRLSETIGFTLEDLAREVTPAYLAQHYGIHVPELGRRFFVVDGEEVEVDFYGEGRRDGETVAVIGEVRSRIYGRDVEAAVRQVGRLVPHVAGTPVTVLFGFVIHPSAREVASQLGAIVISSSGR
jgi:hypothetical protein